MTILTTISNIPGRNITEAVGIVTANTVRTTSAKDDIMTGVKGLFGGELSKASKIIDEARREATDRLTHKAKEMGADAVVGVHYSATSNIFGAVEIFAYGTAVKLD